MKAKNEIPTQMEEDINEPINEDREEEMERLSRLAEASRGVTNMISYWFGESGYSKLLAELNYES